MIQMNMSTVNPTLPWRDISDEKFRSYMFPVNEGEFGFAEVKINEPMLLTVSKSGGHKIIDMSGRSWYIPTGWLAIFWEGYKKDSPTYMF